jgi:hypothetical protein
MMFGVIIGQVVGPFIPIDSEWALGLATSKPINSHVGGFESFYNDCVVDVTIGGGIVGL